MNNVGKCLSGLGFAVALTLLSSCVGTAGYVQVAPPAAEIEVVGVTPGPEFIWIPGHYLWVGSAYVWTPGHWERPPRERMRWEAGRWHRNPSQGWLWIEGRWR